MNGLVEYTIPIRLAQNVTQYVYSFYAVFRLWMSIYYLDVQLISKKSM